MHPQLCIAILFLGLAPTAVCANNLARTPSELLARMDVDHDGRIDVFEYQDYLSYGFHAMDRNGNSVVDLDEFPAHARTPRTRPLPLTRHHDNLLNVFRRQDTNRDGYLNRLELAAPPQ